MRTYKWRVLRPRRRDNDDYTRQHLAVHVRPRGILLIRCCRRAVVREDVVRRRRFKLERMLVSVRPVYDSGH